MDKWHQSCGKGPHFGDRLPPDPLIIRALCNVVCQYLASCKVVGIDIRLVLKEGVSDLFGSPARPQSIRSALGIAACSTDTMGSESSASAATAMVVWPHTVTRPHIHRLYYYYYIYIY